MTEEERESFILKEVDKVLSNALLSDPHTVKVHHPFYVFEGEYLITIIHRLTKKKYLKKSFDLRKGFIYRRLAHYG